MMMKMQRSGKPKLNKKTVVMAMASVTAAAVAVTGVYRLGSRVQDMEVYAKESFTGMKEIVEEHDSENPFRILDITPTRATYTPGGADKTYHLSTGTIGYLTGGQAPIEKDIQQIFLNDMLFYDYTERQELAEALLPAGYEDEDFLTIAYEEAYGGTIDRLDERRDWIKLYDPVGDVGPAGGQGPTGKLMAYVTEVDPDAGEDGEYNLVKGTLTTGLDGLDSLYAFNDSGEWHVTFEYDPDAVIGYVPAMLACDDLSSYSSTTGVYYLNEDGTYEYVGTKSQILGLPEENKKPPKDEEDKTDKDKEDEKTEEGKEPEESEDGDTTGGEDGDNTGDEGEDGDNTGDEGDSGDGSTGDGDGDNSGDGSTGDGDGSTSGDGSTGDGDGSTSGDSSTGDGDSGNSGDSSTGGGDSGNSGDSSSDGSSSNSDAGSSSDASSTVSAGSDTAAADADWRLLIAQGEEDGAPADDKQGQDGDDPKEEDTKPDDGNGSDGGNGAGDDDSSDAGNDSGDDDSSDAGNNSEGGGSSDGGDDSDDSEEENKSHNAGPQYYILEFRFETNPSEETRLYRIKDKEKVPDWDGAVLPYDRYDIDDSLMEGIAVENGVMLDEEADGDMAMSYALGSTGLPVFEYVGLGNGGKYQLKMAFESDENYEDEAQEVEVDNAPVYFRCCKGNNWLERYVFNALEDQDNEYDEFAIEVISIPADEVEVDDVKEADLVYLEHGAGIFLNSGAVLDSIITNDPDGMGDISESVVLAIIDRAVTELMPVIVDYDIIENPGRYEDSNYHKLARIFLKEDLAGFYYDMGKEDLLDDLFRGLDSDDYEDNEDNDCHYVNRNIYMVNGNPLVSKDFPDYFDDDEAKRGFREVLIAIRAENTMLKEDDWLEEEVSKARAVAYIINFSVGIIGDYRDVSILELQPSANLDSDLHVEKNEDRNTTTLYWQKKDSGENGQQIFRATRMVDVTQEVKSVVEFNGEWEDINSRYDMVFIGLDGQRLNREGRDLHTVYNNSDLNGLVYHTGDRASDGDAKYDANDITQQKKEALLDYLRAGYPVVVENNCINVKKSDGKQYRSVNKKYIGDNTQMYAFLEEALENYGDNLYTVRDVRGNPEFRAQLNVIKPRIDYQEQTTPVQSMNRTPDGKYEGTILYRVTGDRESEEDNSYHGDIALHFYLDLNYDGVFVPSEEMYPTGEVGGYISGDGQVTVQLEGVESGIIPWKLEVSDTNNEYRRDAMTGYFTIQGQSQLPVSILQILDDKENKSANLQMNFEKINNSTLGRYLEMAENKLNVEYEIETITTGELNERLAQNGKYLDQWDILVLGFGSSGSLGEAQSAVTTYIEEGRSVLISYAGAQEDTGRLGLNNTLLGQTNEMTYSKLGQNGGRYYRYKDLSSDMFADALPGLQAQKINEGVISRYPFEVGSEEGTAFFSEATMLKAPEYLLDFDNNTGDSELYVTGWYTLNNNGSTEEGGYQVSPRDARNNYYIYSRANVVYIGQNEYPYVYEKDAGEEPKEGVDECKLFVNALMAAYNAGIHNPKIDIVAGFGASATSVESIPIPFDQEFKMEADTDGGILDETVDVYFKFVDNNIAFDKVSQIAFYYENGTNPDAELVLPDGSINTADFTPFGSPVWMVENNRLVEVTDGEFRQGVVYRIKAPVLALKGNEEGVSRIFIALDTHYVKDGKEQHAIGTDSIVLTRAQMFLLE